MYNVGTLYPTNVFFIEIGIDCIVSNFCQVYRLNNLLDGIFI